MSCVVCFHDNYLDPALDDMEAACGCECHFDFDDVVSDDEPEDF